MPAFKGRKWRKTSKRSEDDDDNARQNPKRISTRDEPTAGIPDDASTAPRKSTRKVPYSAPKVWRHRETPSDVPSDGTTPAPIASLAEDPYPVDPPVDRSPESVARRPVSAEVVGPVSIPQIVIGRASPDVEPKVISAGFRTIPFRPDTVIDGWSTEHATVRGASLRGHFHRYNGAPRQDDFAIHRLADGRIVAIVADGVSQAPQSHLGAGAVVKFAVQWLQSHLPEDTQETDWLGLVKGAAWTLAEQAQVLFGLPAPDAVKAEQEFATTLVCAVLEPDQSDALRAFVIGIGDSGAWILRNSEFLPILGGKSQGEGGISSSAVSGLPRVPNSVEPAVARIGFDDVLLLATDGIGDPLGSGQGGVGNLLRELFGRPSPPSLIELAHAVDFSRETFDDDRTLIAITPRATADRASSDPKTSLHHGSGPGVDGGSR